MARAAVLRVPDLVTPQYLFQNLASVHVIDGSWLMKEDARAIWHSSRIPNSVFFDMDACVGDGGQFNIPHMLPSPKQFANHAAALGIPGSDSPIVVYESGIGLFSAARIWYTFRAMGATNIGILDGGLPTWRHSGLPLHGINDPLPRPGAGEASFGARLPIGLVRSLAEVRANVDTRAELVVDARSAARFSGTVPEPRPGLSSGHVPGSVNVPYTLICSPDGRVKSVAELQQIFEAAGLLEDKPVIATCGSGVTACVVLFGLHLLGKRQTSLYDGSWSEWAIPELANPVEK